VFLAGDAAHVHPPAGAQGLNVGLQDAFNLGWKLAAALHGWAAPELLDSYHTERQPAGERVLMHTRAQAELGQRDERMAPVRALLQSIGRSAAVRRGLAAMVTGLETRYEVADRELMARQPWLGKLAPNAVVDLEGERRSIAGCLRDGQALFLSRGDLRSAAPLLAGRAERLAHARIAQDAPSPPWLEDVDAAFIRPDGHIAWLSDGTGDLRPELSAALNRWLGAPSAPAQSDRQQRYHAQWRSGHPE